MNLKSKTSNSLYQKLTVYFLKKPTTSKNPLSFEIVVSFSSTSIIATLPGFEIVPSAEI